MSVIQIIRRAAKRLEAVTSTDLPKIQQELRNARVIGEMAVKFGKQRAQKFVDEFQADQDKQSD
jgi:hypothetical protein